MMKGKKTRKREYEKTSCDEKRFRDEKRRVKPEKDMGQKINGIRKERNYLRVTSFKVRLGSNLYVD